MLWDFNIQCDHIIEARRPDIVVVGKEDKVRKIINNYWTRYIVICLWRADQLFAKAVG